MSNLDQVLGKFNLNNSPYGGSDLIWAISTNLSTFHDDFLFRKIVTNTREETFNFNDSVIRAVEGFVKEKGFKICRKSSGHWVINNFIMDSNNDVMAVISNIDLKAEDEDYELQEGKSYLNIFGEGTLVQELCQILDQFKSGDSQKATLSWHYFMPDGKTTIKTINVDTKYGLHSEFYPFLRKNPEDYFEDFLKSDNSILLMLGPPGTGKTSFLRHMLVRHNINAIVTYDEDIYCSDKFYIDFLAEKKAEMLIIEDAETLIRGRETHNNKVMNKILNASDGLIKLPSKKMIFTANMADDTEIDAALTRPGRCFDVLKFRELTFAEATRAAEAANIKLPVEDRNYTLSELFNEHNKHNRLVKSEHKFGFI